MGDGIAHDIYLWLIHLIAGGAGVHRQQAIPGDGIAHSLCQDIDRIVPALTVVNTGSNVVYLGYKGAADCTFPLFPASPLSNPPVSGGAFTLVWTNPKKNGLVAMCASHAESTVDVMG
jgi:hypothetical protein